MILLEHELTVRRPIEDVFALAADVTQWPRWRTELAEVQQLSPDPVGVGTEYRLTGLVAGQSLSMTGSITHYSPHERLGFKTTSGPVRAALDLRFDAEGELTRIHLTATLTPEGVMRLAEPLIARQAEKMWHEDLDHLKAFLEQGL